MTPVDVGTLVHPGVILDRRTQDELQPPCEADVCLGSLRPDGGIVIVSSRPCDAVAVLALHVRCIACGTTDHVLVCDLHDAGGALATHDGGCGGLLQVLARSSLR